MKGRIMSLPTLLTSKYLRARPFPFRRCRHDPARPNARGVFFFGVLGF